MHPSCAQGAFVRARLCALQPQRLIIATMLAPTVATNPSTHKMIAEPCCLPACLVPFAAARASSGRSVTSPSPSRARSTRMTSAAAHKRQYVDDATMSSHVQRGRLSACGAGRCLDGLESVNDGVAAAGFLLNTGYLGTRRVVPRLVLQSCMVCWFLV